MDLKGLPQTVQNFIEETIQNRENGKFPDNETCQKVMEYAADTGSQKLAGLGLYYLAEYYWQNDQYENTLQCLTESIGYLKDEQMYELLARTYNMMGAVSDRKNNRMVALSSYYNCLQYAEKYHFYYIQGMAESNIAYTLVRMRLRQEAIQHYRTAIDSYSKSEKTYQLNYNRINCMIECGCCHMYTGEMEEALRLWNQIEQIIREAPESYYSKITLEMYRISCELLQGHEEEALKLAADLLEQLSDRDVFEEIMDELVILAGILAILPDGKYLEELIRIIDEKHIEEHYNIFLDLYPFKSEFLQKCGICQRQCGIHFHVVHRCSSDLRSDPEKGRQDERVGQGSRSHRSVGSNVRCRYASSHLCFQDCMDLHHHGIPVPCIRNAHVASDAAQRLHDHLYAAGYDHRCRTWCGCGSSRYGAECI